MRTQTMLKWFDLYYAIGPEKTFRTKDVQHFSGFTGGRASQIVSQMKKIGFVETDSTGRHKFTLNFISHMIDVNTKFLPEEFQTDSCPVDMDKD